ncbi:MAG: DUF4397 domain-containing protein [Gemmatimonas sp.]|jgi:hypothetical protein|uniref:DUF4397 domain-containing protein n=1 Tax=Gemmatimonas sp. TaxID=1962908 RepID=UPI0031BEB3AF|nr:DUF4397 domain-containing protein [Gemmatimonas sp.]
MRTSLLTLSLVAAASAAACKGERTADTAVQTTTAEGRLASPSEATAERRGTSLVRMINALPAGGGATVNADDRALFSSVDYRTVTPYTEIKDNVNRFRLQGTGLDTTIATNNEIMLDGSRYTMLALPEKDGGVRLRVLHDEFEPDSTKVRLRIVHGLSGIGDIDVSIQGREGNVFDNVNPTADAGFQDVDAGATSVIVKVDGSGKQLIKKEMRFERGHAYTLVLTGGSTIGRAQRVEAIVVDDKVSATNTGGMVVRDTGKRGPG